MAALTLVLVVTMALYHWLAFPLIGGLTGVVQAGWLPWVALAVGTWLLAGRR